MLEFNKFKKVHLHKFEEKTENMRDSGIDNSILDIHHDLFKDSLLVLEEYHKEYVEPTIREMGLRNLNNLGKPRFMRYL